MTNRLMVSVAAIALLAGAGFAHAQGAGGAGGHVVVAGTPDVVARHRGSLTAPFLGALICLMIEVAVGRQRAV